MIAAYIIALLGVVALVAATSIHQRAKALLEEARRENSIAQDALRKANETYDQLVRDRTAMRRHTPPPAKQDFMSRRAQATPTPPHQVYNPSHEHSPQPDIYAVAAPAVFGVLESQNLCSPSFYTGDSTSCNSGSTSSD